MAGLSTERPFAICVAGTPSELVLARETRRSVDALLARAAGRAPGTIAIGVRGRPGSGREALARGLAAALGFPALVVPGAALDDDLVRRAVTREATWHLAAVVLAGAPSPLAAARLVRELPTPLLLTLDETEPSTALVELRAAYEEVAVAELATADRAAVWERALAGLPGARALDVPGLAARHALGAGQIARLGEILAAGHDPGRSLAIEDVAAARRRLATTGASALARRLACPYAWDDIVLAPSTERELRLVRAWGRHGASGLRCLFFGPPGTGKTMAAQVLARELGLELLRVDLSQVVNKYLGETEKNLDRAFELAEDSGAVLFFDEADALFTHRTEVRDANDRYANLETAFLLQRVETHRGLVILATNLRGNFDGAFLRRIHVIAEFPIPGIAERQRIWERNLVGAACASDVDLELLARQFPTAGGDICNAVATARLLAAEEAAPLASRHLAIGMWRELAKSGRIISPDDFGPMRDAIQQYLAR